MTKERFETAYLDGFRATLRFVGRVGAADPEEVTQAAWQRGWERIHQLRDDRRVGAWISSIAVRSAKTAARRDGRVEQLLTEYEARGSCNISDDAIDLRRALDECCTPRQKRLMHLLFWEGRSFPEAASRLRMSVEAAYADAARARARMRNYLRPSSAKPARTA